METFHPVVIPPSNAAPPSHNSSRIPRCQPTFEWWERLSASVTKWFQTQQTVLLSQSARIKKEKKNRVTDVLVCMLEHGVILISNWKRPVFITSILAGRVEHKH